MRKGFTIIEILIAMLILFIAIVFINMSIKTFNNYQRKSEIYQNFYITALSLKDWISQQSFENNIYEGKLNGLEYRFDIKLLIQKKNYTISMSSGAGNYGNIMIKLYQVNMNLKGFNHEKNFKFYVTKQQNLFSQNLIQEVIK